MKQFIMTACAALVLTACGGGTTPDYDDGVAQAASTYTPAIEPVTVLGDRIEQMPVEEATGALKRLGGLINNPERGVVVVFDGPVKPDGFYASGIITTGDFSYAAENDLRDYVAGGRTNASWDLLEASKEVLRGFLKDPKNVDLVAPIVMKEVMGGDAREFLKATKAVLSAKFVPVPGNASAWYGKFRYPGEDGPAVLDSEEYATATAVVRKVIPDLNPGSVSLYMFLHRRYQEGGAELVETYQKWGLRAIAN